MKKQPFRLSESDILRIGGGVTIVYLALMLFSVWLGATTNGYQDFKMFWSAARYVLSGEAAKVYDYHAIAATFPGMQPHPAFAFHYPPIAFFIYAPFGALPYPIAYILFVALSAALFLTAMWKIIPNRVAMVGAIASPALLCNLGNGQNGLLTAGLLALSLMHIERRPKLSGVALAFLCFKPQLAVAVAFAYLVSGRWKALLSAFFTGILLLGLSIAVFGVTLWADWLHHLAENNHYLKDVISVMVAPASLYAVLLYWGVNGAMAYTVFGVTAVFAAFILVKVWRSDAAMDLKCATAAVAATMLSPYLFCCDLTALVVGLAFWLRHVMSTRDVTENEKITAALVWLLPYWFMLGGSQAIPLPLSTAVLLVVLSGVALKVKRLRS